MSSLPFSPPATSVACPKCTAQVPCYDPAGSAYFCCFNCGTYFRFAPAEPGSVANIVSGFKQKLLPSSSLPLGAAATLGGYHCRLTGYQLRSEKNDRTAEWREYQLRPVEALVGDDPIDFPLQLAEYQGHWLLIRRARTFPVTKGTHAFQGQEWTSKSTGNAYRLWHRYEPIIRDAQGEFDWNILDDEQLTIQEFTCPPYLLSSEQPLHERPTWYLAEHLEPAQVAAAFGLSVVDLPARESNGAAQPNPIVVKPLVRITLLLGLLLLGLQSLVLTLHPTSESEQEFVLPATLAAPAEAALPRNLLPERSVPFDSLPATPAPDPTATATPALAPATSQMLVSAPILIAEPMALSINLNTPELTNHWVEVTASLVNEQTGRGYEFTRSLEYYEGVEGGESWAEGSRAASAVLSHVPAGRYHLNLYPTTEPSYNSTSLRLTVEQNTPLWSNFWVVSLLLLSVPFLQWWRYANFESNRWANSNFSPKS